MEGEKDSRVTASERRVIVRPAEEVLRFLIVFSRKTVLEANASTSFQY